MKGGNDRELNDINARKLYGFVFDAVFTEFEEDWIKTANKRFCFFVKSENKKFLFL